MPAESAITLNLTGDVDERMLRKTIKAVANARQSCQPLIVEITSSGGDSDIALAIAGQLRTVSDLTTVVFGRCFSAATLIFAAGHKRCMQKWAWCMLHEASEGVEGTASFIKEKAKAMERNEVHWNSIMFELTGTEAKVWEKLNERDTYLTADECLKLNLATHIF